MPAVRPGVLGVGSNHITIDAGTNCRSASSRPGPTGEVPSSSEGTASVVGLGVLSEMALGDFHEGESTWAGTIANVGVGLIPIVGQLADARDTAAAAVKVWEMPSSGARWAGLGMAVIGWVPLVGDAAKGVTKLGKKAVTEVGQRTEKQLVNKAAPGIGERMIKEEKRTGLNVDVAAQEHRHKTDYRAGSGREVQSAHTVNSSSVSGLPNYVRDKALTVLLPAKHHKAFDDYWKAWARERISKLKPGEEPMVAVAEWEQVLNRALDSVPELRGRTADTMSFMIRTELYQTLGLKPDQLIRLPFSK